MKRNFEHFRLYGFSIDYPDECRVEFNNKSRRQSGDMSFQFPDKVRIFLTWGELEKVSKRFKSTEEHAEYSLNAMQKGKNVKNFERVSRDSMASRHDKGTVNKVRFDEMASGPFARGKATPREAHSMHVHCENSKRYFVLYTMTPRSDEGRYDKIMAEMRDSFKCH